MSTVAGLLAELNAKQAAYNQATVQSILISRQYESAAAKMAKYTKYEEDWGKAYDDALDNTSEKRCKDVIVPKDNQCEQLAFEYAEAKVPNHDPDELAEIADFESDLESLKTVIETEMELLKGQIEGIKTQLSENAGDNGMVGP